MSKADVAAVDPLAGATLYAIFGGADFGAGLWDLLAARTPDRGRRQRIEQRSRARWARSGRRTTSG